MAKSINFILVIFLLLIFGCSKESDLITDSNSQSKPSFSKLTTNTPNAVTGTLPFDVSVSDIQFDYDHANNTDDGIDIRYNWTTDYHNSDYIPSLGWNEPFAYVKGKQNVKIKIFITATNADQTYRDSVKIVGRLVSGGEIGNFSGTIILSSRSVSTCYGNGYLVADGAVASTVGINGNLRWEWHVVGWNNNICDYTITTTGPHTLYRLYSLPTAPWYLSGNPLYGDPLINQNNGRPTTNYRGMEPHVQYVLENACAWASGLSDPNAIVSAITNNVYYYFGQHGIQYSSASWSWFNPFQLPVNYFGAGPFSPNYFYIENVDYFYNDLSWFADCHVASDYVHTLTTALGINTSVIDLKKSDGSAYGTTACQPFGSSGYSSQAFSMHQVIYYNGKIWDPTATYASNGYTFIDGVTQSSFVSLAVSPGDAGLIVWGPPVTLLGVDWENRPAAGN
jgi:hypothetical protein